MENIDVSNALKITPSKSEDLIQARIDKIDRLSAISRKIAAGTADYIANQAKTSEAKSNSAVGILSNVTGIDFTPEKSIIGTGLNTAVGLGSGLSRLSGYVASGIHDANALLLNKDIPQEVKDARARQLQGQATPEDEKLLALPRGDLTERKVAPDDFMHRVRKDFKSNLSQIQDMEESLKNAQSLREAFDFSSAVHQGTKDALTDDLKHTTVEDLNQVSEGWDALKQGKVIAGLKDMASGIAGSTPKIADAAIKHPLGTAQFLAENLPNTLAAATGAAGMVASNAAYALDTMGQGMTERTKALKGAMPTNEDLAWNALWSSTAGLAETYGDKLMGIPKLFKGAPKEVVEAAKDMNKSSFIKSLLNSGPVKTTAAITKGAAGEYVTEGYQAWAENAAKVKETSLEEAFTGAAIGAITGGVMSGSIHGVAELAGSTPEKIKAKEDVVATQVAHDTAILNNDTTAYLDPTTPQYSPTKALEVLYAHAKLDTTTPEVKTTNLNKASDVVAMAEQDLKTVLEANDIAKRSPEQLIAAKDELVQLKSLIESTNPDDKSRLTALSQEVSYLERGLQASASKIAARQLTAEIKSRTTELNTARTLQEQLTTVVSGRVSPESVSKDIEVASLPLNVADQPAVESSQQAIGRLIKLSMANTQAITHEAATMLANDTANTLTDPQRLYLREFSAARIAQNKLQTTESVGATILSGDGLNLGLKQYQQYIGRALEAGNTKVASNYIAMLENFVDSHEQKAILATAAMEKAKDTNRSIKILKSKDGRWGYAPAGVEITREMIEKNGGLVLHPNSLKSNALAKAVPVEAEALKQALVAHKAAFALTFNQPATSVTPAAQTPATPSSAASVPSAVPPSPVPPTKETNVTQTPEAKQSQSQASSTSSGSTAATTSVQPVAYPAASKPPGVSQHTWENATTTVDTFNKSNPSLLGKLIELHAQDKTATEVAKTLGISQESVRELRMGLGLPEQGKASGNGFASIPADKEERDKFEAWRDARNKSPADSPKAASVGEAVAVAAAGVEAAKDTQDSKPAVESATSPLKETVSVEKTAEVESRSEQAPETTTPEVGTLSVFSLPKSAKGTVYTARNLLADYFTQAVEGIGGSTQRPLVAVKDFMTKGSEAFTQFLAKNSYTASDKQNQVLTLFENKVKEWTPLIQNALVRGNRNVDNPTFYYKDPFNWLINQIGERPNGKPIYGVEENVSTALVYAAFSTLLELADGGQTHDASAINKILGRPADAELPDRAFTLLSTVGVRANVLRSSSGQTATSALGLKTTADAGKNLMSDLEGSMGVRVEKLLLDLGLIQRITVPGAEMNDLVNMLNEMDGKPPTTNDATSQHRFIRIAKDKNGEFLPAVKEIIEASKGSNGILDKLFSVETHLKYPSFTPTVNTQTKTKTGQVVPDLLNEVNDQNRNQANYARQDMWAVLSDLDPVIAEGLVGVVPVDKTVQKTKRAGMQSKMDGLKRELQRYTEYMNDVLFPSENSLDQPIYLDYSVWLQQRVGIETNVINPQTSKAHRNLFFRKDWESKIDLTNQDMVNNFLMRVGEGFGIKTDRQSVETSLIKIDNLFANDGQENSTVLNTAIEDLRSKIYEGTSLTQEQQANLLKAVQLGEENLHTLNALVAMAHLTQAEATKQTSFTTHLIAEVDGVANGPILSHAMFGAAATAEELNTTMARGGIFTTAAQAEDFPSWKSNPLNTDLYEHTVGAVVLKIREVLAGEKAWTESNVDAVYFFTGQLETDNKVTSDGRKIIKGPVTEMVFGANVNKSLDHMAQLFVEKVYDIFEKSANGDAKYPKQAVIRQINQLLRAGKSHTQLSLDTDLLEGDFNNEDEAALRQAFLYVLQKPVKATINKNFETFLARRDTFNQTAALAHGLYDAVYRATKNQMIQELIEQEKKEPGTGIPVTYRMVDKIKVYDVPLRDLSQKEEKQLAARLERMAPVAYTLLSKESKQPDAGLKIGDVGRKLSGNPTYTSQVQFATPFADTGNTPDSKPEYSSASHGYEETLEAPGVAMLPLMTHSTDSYISHMAQKGMELLNIHDAVVAGVGTIHEAAKRMNQQTFHALLNYSPMSEMHDALARTVAGLVGLVRSGTLSDEAASNIEQFLYDFGEKNEINPAGAISYLMKVSKREAAEADTIKLTAMKEWTKVNQYAREGDSYTVTLEDQELIDAGLAKVSEELPANTLANLLYLEEQNAAGVSSETTEVTPKPAASESANWGELGSNANSETSMVSLFDKSDVLSAREVMDALVTEYKKTPKQASSKFALMLLEQLRKVVSPKLVVRMIRPDTAKSDVIGADTGTFDNVLGEYRLDGTEQAIYVMGPEFKHSGVTAELLLHELLHAALSWVLYDVKNGTGTAAAKILYKSLDSLRQRAIERANKTKDLKHFAKILEGESGVDELISWGLSNQEFQTKVLREVTMAIALPSQTQGIVSMNGMQAFLQAIRKFFFRATKVEPVTETGLAVLLANVSGLFAEANTAEQKTARNINLSMAAQINTFSTLDIHEALDTGEVSDAFNAHLRNVLTNIVEKLHGSFGSFKESIMKSVPHSAIDAWALAQANGETPFVSDLQASGFQFNNQTYFVAEQVEATVKSILDSKDGKLSSVREELRKLEAEVRSKLTVQSFYQGPDWATATPQEQAEAQQLYDYLFKKVDDDYLARFAALGLSHEGFNTLLKMPTKQAPAILKDRTVGNTLMNLFDRVLVALNGKLTHTKAGQAADVKLVALVRQLVEIENRKKAVLNQVSTGILAFADKKVRASRRGTKNQISKLVNSTMFKRNKNVTIAAVSHVVDAVMGNRVKYLVQNMNKMRNDVFPGAQGAIASALAEMNGNSHDLQKVLREGKAHLEGARKKIISYANKQALESFVDGGVYLADEAKSAVTNVLLRTGAHVLLGKYDMKQIADLVNNKATLLKEIASYEAQLSKFTPAQQEFFLYQSKALGYHLAGYGEKSASLLKNASNIAKMYTTTYQGQLNEADTLEATKTIDVLTTLYALQYSRSADIAALASVFTTENSRTDGDNNGLRMVLLMQQSSEQESLARLFNDDPVQMAKGYIPEIYNPHTDLKAATKDEGEILENLGYKKVSDLGLDPHDVYREGHALYVMRDGGLRPWLSGMFSFTNMRAKGTKHHGERAVGTQNGLDRARQRAVNDMFLPGAGRNFDPTQVKENYMVPVLNPMGKAVNYQYLMQASTKDRLLERDSRFDTVLGALAGSVFDKDNSPKHNRKVVEVLHADFEKEFAKDAKAFRTVGPSSPDPELREIYAMLPQSTKDTIKDVWGSDSMLVHVGNLDIAFGYRKLSMSTMFSKDAAERDAIDKAAVFLLENILKQYAKVFLHYDDAEAEKYSKRTAVTVQRAENIWQAVVHEVKDIYVIKNIITSMNNISSNMLTLFLYGVTPMNGLRDMRIAWVGAEEHHRDSEQLFKLQNLLSTGYVTGDTSHIQSEIDRLSIAIKNNPVTEMINAGLMPTIVEDVANEDDPYSYKSAFIKSTEKYTSKLNSSVRSAGKVAYMSHDTKVYQSLARITQLSDFVARYALYQQLTTRKENPVSKEVAIQEASDAFINYDVPMNRNLQYMDDMGIFMFTKYFLRIQRVIRGRFIHSSGKMALMLGAESYLGSMPTIMDASVLVRAGNNPLGMGALQFPSAIGEIAPIAATRAMAHGLFNM